MKNNLKMIITAILMSLLFLTSCTKDKEDDPLSVRDLEIEHEEEFGGIYVKMTIEDFNELGFAYGDSVDVSFDNGYSLEDIPYFNGYYVNAGEPLLVGYPGYDYIKVTVNYGDDLWDDFNLQMSGQSERPSLWKEAKVEHHNKATIVLHEKGKYLDVQNASDIHYYDEREKYDSDEMFANFRAMNVGDLKKDIIYRSASPCDNQHNRASYVDALIKDAGVDMILDLADNDAKIERYIDADDFASPYFLSLYEDNKVCAIALNMNYLSDEFGYKIVSGFRAMMESEGPYLIHCTEGKDRTGFTAMLIEALCGADYDEIIDDYMLTYDNYYRINEKDDKEKYDTILGRNILAMLRFLEGEGSDLQKDDLSVGAKNYLLKYGMTEEEIETFIFLLCRE